MDVVLYIYYSIDPAKNKETEKAVTQLFAQVKTKSGVQGRLLCRMEDATTWLEVYGPVKNADSLLEVIEEAAFDQGFKQLLVKGTARHAERFVPME